MTIKAEDEKVIDEAGKSIEKILPIDFNGKVELNFSKGRYERANVVYGLLRKQNGSRQ
jgi:hypothetical protein